MYGSAGSTESIIFMPHENTRKAGEWQGERGSNEIIWIGDWYDLLRLTSYVLRLMLLATLR